MSAWTRDGKWQCREGPGPALAEQWESRTLVIHCHRHVPHVVVSVSFVMCSEGVRGHVSQVWLCCVHVGGA